MRWRQNLSSNPLQRLWLLQLKAARFFLMEKQAYWHYLNESLGIESFLIPKKAHQDKPEALAYNPQAALGFFINQNLSQETQELFEKMVLAMGLKLTDVGLFSVDKILDKNIPCKLRVNFSESAQDKEMGQWQEPGAFRLLHTYSLETLLKNPQFKKSTWEHLKMVRSLMATFA